MYRKSADYFSKQYQVVGELKVRYLYFTKIRQELRSKYCYGKPSSTSLQEFIDAKLKLYLEDKKMTVYNSDIICYWFLLQTTISLKQYH